MNLFDINRSIRDFIDNLYLSADEDGVIPEGDLKALEELTEARDTKIENIALYIKELDAEEEALKAEAEKLKVRAQTAQNKARRLREYLTLNLQNNEISKFETSRCKITFRKSEAVDVDENLIPKKYMNKKVTFSPDKKTIKELLKAGKAVKGATLITKDNIQIK